MQFDLEKDGEEYFEYLQKVDFAQFNSCVDVEDRVVQERIEPEIIGSVTKLPGKIVPGEPPLSEKLSKFKTQQAYIDSLNLREMCYKTFSTL